MAVNKTINKRTNTHGAMRNCIEYVLRQDKTGELLTYVTGPYCHDEINYDLVYRTFLEEKKMWNKDSGRMYAHNIISWHKDEQITLEQAFEFGKEFAEKWFSGFQTLVAVHKDNIIAPATAVYSLLHSITGSIGIILASVWQIPLCLYLARKTGMFVPIVLNTILGIVLSTATALGNTIAWWFVPYCWAAKLAEPLMGIEINGTYAGNCGFSIAIMISISLSILLFLILSYADAKDFSKGR